MPDNADERAADQRPPDAGHWLTDVDPPGTTATSSQQAGEASAAGGEASGDGVGVGGLLIASCSAISFRSASSTSPDVTVTPRRVNSAVTSFSSIMLSRT